MLTAGALNGIAIWFRNIIEWFRRIWYYLHGAVAVTGTCEKMGQSAARNGDGSGTFRFTYYQGSEKTVTVIAPEKAFEMCMKGKEAELLWIPGTKKAMLSIYRTDEKSRRTLMICDTLSVVGLVALIVGFVMMGTLTRSGAGFGMSRIVPIEALVLGGIVLMIIMSIIRKKLRK